MTAASCCHCRGRRHGEGRHRDENTDCNRSGTDNSMEDFALLLGSTSGSDALFSGSEGCFFSYDGVEAFRCADAASTRKTTAVFFTPHQSAPFRCCREYHETKEWRNWGASRTASESPIPGRSGPSGRLSLTAGNATSKCRPPPSTQPTFCPVCALAAS